ncbi:MAG TPA: hypothetical protein VHB79_37350 [Polyangiaceae bacterium]|nr:hypothetical protein [Polyangiaceae bacterium]
MNQDIVFVIPTYRLRDVGTTVEQYDQHFWNNGHAVRMVVFDDSTSSTQEKYYPLLEQTKTHNELYYVGPQQKERFLAHLSRRLRDKRLESLLRNLFRPSYGGNRNYTLMYTLGELMISADDDMRPHALMENRVETLTEHEVCRGKLLHGHENGFSEKSFDIVSAFVDVLGKRVQQAPANYARGAMLIDTAMDLETNASKGLCRENSLMLEQGPLDDQAVVKVAQTFRSGTHDMDATDFIEMFFDDERQIDPDELNQQYVLVNFRPAVTDKNWRMDCGVAGYDNEFGLPPFFPTRLRFEDYIYRLWIQQDGLAAAHVDAAQHHIKNNYMRNPPAAEIFNEEVSNLLKRKIKGSVSRLDDMGISFDYDGSICAEDAEHILERIKGIHARAMRAVHASNSNERQTALNGFASSLEKSFYGFEPDFFQQNLARIVDDVLSVIRGSMELWPTLVEIAFFEKARHGLPELRVANQRL